MNFKQKLCYTAFGAVIMLIGMLTVNLLNPITAQTTPQDAAFGKIYCTGLYVIDSNSNVGTKIKPSGIQIYSSGTTSVATAFLGIGDKFEHGILTLGDAQVILSANVTGGNLEISNNKNTRVMLAGTNLSGDGAIITWDKSGKPTSANGLSMME